MNSTLHVVGGVSLPRPFKLRRLGHVGVFHSDLDAARVFYVDQLGFRLTDELLVEPDTPALGLFMSHGTDHHAYACLDAMMVKGSDPKYDGGVTINQLSFQVGTLEEVVRGHAHFEQLGLQVMRVGRDAPGSNWAVYVFDPDGHAVELYYGMEQVGWDRRSKPLPARVPSSGAPILPQPSEQQELRQAEAALQAEGSAMPPGFRPDEPLPYDYNVGGVMLQRPFKINRVGPVYLFVDNVDRSVQFYTQVMGMEVTETVTWNGHQVAYLRCGTDHHVVALVPSVVRAELAWPDSEGRPTSTMCIGIELCSYQQLRDAREYLLRQGCRPGPQVPHPLRPGIGHAAFFLDPAQQNLMLYCGMEQVGWDGRPRPAELRPVVTDDWPATIEATSDTYVDQLLQGPLG